MRTINDWKPETKDLLDALTAAGFALVWCSNGGDKIKFNGNLDEFMEELLGADDAHLGVELNGKRHWLYLVYGNSPGELVCDYGVPKNPASAALLDSITQAHSDKWEGRQQPTRNVD